MKKRYMSLICNSLIVILEIVGLIVTLNSYSKVSFEYYTIDSNILALIVSAIFIVYMLLKKEMPTWLRMLKYSSAICLSVTFLVVIFILAPMYEFSYGHLLFSKELLYMHLLCPVLSIITFIFFDEIESFNRKDNFAGLTLTIIYGIVLIILNLLSKVSGPYPFLKVREQSAAMSLLWLVVIFALAYFIGLALRKAGARVRKKVK